MAGAAAWRVTTRAAAGACLLLVLLAAPAVTADDAVRSELYPPDWVPGRADDEGRFLHDFSYAGYRYGEDVPATVTGPVLDVTRPPYGADPSGDEDATVAIQARWRRVSTARGW